ncbi:MAG TPA: hypothetical protein VKF14_06475 [Candidatus Dormibacteraeota bacterium]|nr:hypothetical protein [Candidatus Dormibacteraeota bacterium]
MPRVTHERADVTGSGLFSSARLLNTRAGQYPVRRRITRKLCSIGR